MFSKKKAIIALALALTFTVGAGTFAWLTDVVTQSANVTAVAQGVTVETSTGDPIATIWANNTGNAAKIAAFVPGDTIDLSYTLTNPNATSGVKYRETFVIYSSTAMNLASGWAWTLTDSSGAAVASFSGPVAVGADNKTISYTGTAGTLAASGSVALDYGLHFAELAPNTFQGATVTVSYVIEVLQEGGDWTAATTGTITINGNSFSVTPSMP